MSKNNKKAELSKEREAEKKYKDRSAAFDRLNIILFVSALFFTGLCLTFLVRPTISELEKRELEEKPEFTPESYLDGSFADKYTKYFSDTVPYRDNLTELSASITKLMGVATPTFYGNVSVVSDDDDDNTPPVQTAAPAPNDTPAAPADDTDNTPDSGNEGGSAVTDPAVTAPEETAVTEEEEEEEEFTGNIAEFSNNGIIVDSVKMYGDKAGVMLFGGNKSVGTRYAELISEYKRALGDSINVYNMVVPTSVEFYLPKKFSKYSSSEKDAIDHIYSSYTAGVIPIDAYSEIAAHTDEYIYLRTDHHWTQRGAYYAYKAFVESIGMTASDINKDYEVKTKEGFVGSLYSYTGDVTLKNSPEIFTYYKPQTEYTTYYYKYDTLAPNGTGTLFYEAAEGANCYGMFVGGDAVHTKTVTKAGSGRKIAVFKESYGNAFIPYLVDNFDEIYVIDIRYFGRNAVQYIKDNGITDVMFINNAFAANTNSLIDGIENLLRNEWGTLSADKIPAVKAYLGITDAPAETTAAAADPAQTQQTEAAPAEGTQPEQPPQT